MIRLCVIFNPRLTKPFFVTRLTKGGGGYHPLVNLKMKYPDLISTMVQQGVFSFHTYQNKYQHAKYGVTVTS